MDLNAHLPAPAKALPNKRDTLKRILDCARREFAAQGLAAARVDDIAQAAGVTKQLVYHYFHSKDELFACVLEALAALAMANLVALDLDALPPRTALRTLLDTMIAPYCDGEVGALAQEAVRFHARHDTPQNSFGALAPALTAKMQGILARGVASGEFRADLDAGMLMAMAAVATSGAFVSRYTVSTLCGLDLAQPAGAAAWSDFSIAFVLAAVAL